MTRWGPWVAQATGALVLAGAAVVGAVSPAAAADPACDVGQVPPGEDLAGAETQVDPVHQRLHVESAHELARGRGTKVAVVDSGVASLPGLARVGLHRNADTQPTLLSGHGSIVASLAAGPTGVAPEATVYDVKVYDAEDADTTEGEQPVTSRGIAAGIRAVIAAHPREQFDVVNISLSVPQSDPDLEAAVRDLVALDVVVVASSGNRPTTPAEGFTGTPGSDADVYPADYDGVLAVSASVPDGESPSTYVLPNRDTDVAAPTLGALGVNATGQTCVVDQVATSWAAAEVSGLALLVRERFPDETAAQVTARIMATTEGAGLSDRGDELSNPWTGAGVVQAHDALTREVDPTRRGRVRRGVEAVDADAVAPPAPRQLDLLGPARAKLLWFGLLAGGLLALAFVLRPLLRR